jgi:hypothetical protein
VNNVLKGLGILIALGAILGSAYWVFFADDGNNNPFTRDPRSTLIIICQSTHIVNSADFKLYINDEEVDSFKLGPGGLVIKTYHYRSSRSQGPHYIEIKLVSTGGGLGTQTDTVSVLVGKGQIHNITLRA